MRVIATVAACAMLVACGGGDGAANVEGMRDELIAADRAFAEATAERGLDGWMSYFADDAVEFERDGPASRGLAAIRERDAGMFEDGEVRLVWEPDDAGGFRDGRYGYTRGPYRVLDAGTGEERGRGRYLTIWRRGPDGWKVVLDTGTPDPVE